jgi:hypothetical protein
MLFNNSWHCCERQLNLNEIIKNFGMRILDPMKIAEGHLPTVFEHRGFRSNHEFVANMESESKTSDKKKIDH